MKSFISRLIGGSGAGARAAQGQPPAQPEAAGGAGGDEQRYAEVSFEFFRWLAGPAAGPVAADTEKLVLEQLARLAALPAEAADLVPRMPDVIPQLLRSLRDDDAAGADLARLVAQDVVLLAAVIREANSAYYRRATQVDSLEAAIMILGQNGLRMLIARVALKPLISMQSGRIARLVAPRIWSQSEKCATAAGLLAPGLRANPFEAYLAGLMQNVGLMAAVRLVDQTCPDEGLPRSDAFTAGLLAAARTISARVAAHWELPESVPLAIAQAGYGHAAPPGQALGLGDMLAKLRLMIDAGLFAPGDPFVAEGLDGFQLRCLEKLRSQD